MQQLNELCDRNTQLNVKGASYWKKQKKMIVVFSNYSINECYHKVYESDPNGTEPLHARFNEIQLTETFGAPPVVGKKRTVPFMFLSKEEIQERVMAKAGPGLK